MDEMILTPAEKMERVVERLTRERDDARAERDAAWVVRDAGWEQTEDALTRMRTAEGEVARLEGLILDCGDDAPGSAGKLNREAHRIRAQREHKHHWFTFDETHVRCDGCGETRREEGRVLYVGEVEPT